MLQEDSLNNKKKNVEPLPISEFATAGPGLEGNNFVNNPQVVGLKTELTKERMIIKWTISNFSLFYDDESKIDFQLNSPRVEMNKIYKEAPRIFWGLNLNPYKKDESSRFHIALFLNFQKDDFSSKFLTYKINANWYFSILTCDNIEYHRHDLCYTFEKNTSFGFNKYIGKDFLYENKDVLLPNDELTIICSIDVGLHYKTLQQIRNLDKIPESIVLPPLEHKHQLESLVNDDKFCDINFICEDKELKAHKVILAAYSPVFWEMFENDTNKVSSNKQIVVADVSFKALKEMKNFIYTGEIENIQETIYDLMVLANKYAISCLKVLCEHYYCNYLNNENALEMLVVAEEFMANELKQKTIDLIILNQKEIINVESQSYMELMAKHPQLVAEIFTSLVMFKVFIISYIFLL